MTTRKGKNKRAGIYIEVEGGVLRKREKGVPEKLKGARRGMVSLALTREGGEGSQRGERRAHTYNRLRMARILERNIDIEEEGMERDEN